MGTVAFEAALAARTKRPIIVIKQYFDKAKLDAIFCTSSASAKLPPGATAYHGTVKNVSGTSQKIYPDKNRTDIGRLSVELVDKGRALTDLYRDKIAAGNGLAGRTIKAYLGFDGLEFDDYYQYPSQTIHPSVSVDGSSIKIRCADAQVFTNEKIFIPAKTQLSASISESDTTIMIESLTGFTDGLARTVPTVLSIASIIPALAPIVCFKVDDEWMACLESGVLDAPPRFENVIRGAFGSLAVEHETSATERKTSITRITYIEMPAGKIVQAILTGELQNQVGAMPSAWTSGIDPSLVDIDSLIAATDGKWNPASDATGLQLKFLGQEEINAKLWLESELYPILGIMPVIGGDGRIGFRKIEPIYDSTAFDVQVDESDIISMSPLVEDSGSIINDISINWYRDHLTDETTWTTRVINANSISKHVEGKPKSITLNGLSGSAYSDDTLKGLVSYYNQRYSAPPLKRSMSLKFAYATLSPGQRLRVASPHARDYTTNDDYRTYEIQSVKPNWVNGSVSVELFGTPEYVPPTQSVGSAGYILDAYYESIGTPIDDPSTGVIITNVSGEAHITTGGTLVGSNTLMGGVYYYAGDLWLDPGVTINITQNVFIWVRGFFTRDGIINGSGAGIPGAVAVIHNNIGDAPAFSTGGGVGVTKSAGGAVVRPAQPAHDGDEFSQIFPYESQSNSSVAASSSDYISWSGAELDGVHGDLRGAAGGAGRNVMINDGGIISHGSLGGTGGTGGAGLGILCRGMAGNGAINLSGGDGLVGEPMALSLFGKTSFICAGSGAGAYPGRLKVFYDGSYAITPIISSLIMNTGTTITPPAIPINDTFYYDVMREGLYYYRPDYPGFYAKPEDKRAECFNEITFVANNAPSERPPNPDKTIVDKPILLLLITGDAAIALDKDGANRTRIKAEFAPPANNIYYNGMEIQYRISTDAEYTRLSSLVPKKTEFAFIDAIHGLTYFVRIRAVNLYNNWSGWVELSIVADGKGSPPGNILSITTSSEIGGVQLSITPPPDNDIAHFRVWKSASNNKAFSSIVARPQDTNPTIPLPAGSTEYIWVDVVDRSGNVSASSYPVSATAGLAVSASAVEYSDVASTPTELADINVNEGWHLGSIEMGADVSPAAGNLIKNSDFLNDLSFWEMQGTTPDSVLFFGRNYSPDWTLENGSTAYLMQTNGDEYPGTYKDILAQSDPSERTAEVVPWQWYQASAYVGSHRCNVRLHIGWYRSDGTAISFSACGESLNEYGGGRYLAGYNRIWGVAQAPAGSVRALVFVKKYPTLQGIGATSSFAFVTRAMFGEGAEHITSPSPWAPADSRDARLINYADSTRLEDLKPAAVGADPTASNTAMDTTNVAGSPAALVEARAATGATFTDADAGGLAYADVADFGTEVGGTGKPADNADVTRDIIESVLAILSGGITLGGSNARFLVGAAVDVANGVGGFFGMSGGYPKFRVGDPSKQNYFLYDGETQEVLIGRYTQLKGADAYFNKNIYLHEHFHTLEHYIVNTNIPSAGSATATIAGGYLRMFVQGQGNRVRAILSGSSISYATFNEDRAFSVEIYTGADIFPLTVEVMTGGVASLTQSNSFGFQIRDFGSLYGITRDSLGNETSVLLSAVSSYNWYTLSAEKTSDGLRFFRNGSQVGPLVTTNLPTLTMGANRYLVYEVMSSGNPGFIDIGEFKFLQTSD